MAKFSKTRVVNVRQYKGFFIETVVRPASKYFDESSYDQVGFKSETLLEFLRGCGASDTFYGNIKTKRIPLSELIDVVADIETTLESAEIDAGLAKSVTKFLKVCRKANKEFFERYEMMMADGVISFDMLRFHFKEGNDVSWKDRDVVEAGRVKSVENVSMFFGDRFVITTTRITHDDGRWYISESSTTISAFDGTIKISDLPVQLLTDDTRAMLNARADTVVAMTTESAYRSYQGSMYRQTYNGYLEMSANGRCMIDSVMFGRMNDFEIGGGGMYDRTTLSKGETIPEELRFTCPGFVTGFSFSRKKWGEFKVANIDEIDFRDTAYDTLVLEEETKAEVRALVEYSEHSFSDIISGKGGGTIFLLHGPPGVGKTLTAESVAEILHRPLYSVSVGELGTSPKDVEETLGDILEMVTVWNAVLLLDEADIFLEERTKDDIQRNAMVGVFLRLLEYHNGVLFLTTNRVQQFDKAILSRISVIMRYEDFTQAERKLVWEGILGAAGIPEGVVDTEYMANTYDINGRQVKSAIRTAMTRAHSMQVAVNQAHIERVVKRMIAVVEQLDTAALVPTKGELFEKVDRDGADNRSWGAVDEIAV